MINQVRRLRPWLALAGAVLAVAVLVPPAGTAATRFVFAQALQFAVLAVVAPALIVLGAPWRRASLRPALAGGRVRAGDGSPWPRLADRVAAARSHRPAPGGGRGPLVAPPVVAMGWQPPISVDDMVPAPW
ncbi:MAG: hypothetical protein ACR2FU_20945, partial [Streptosporangiaceae bacterium]